MHILPLAEPYSIPASQTADHYLETDIRPMLFSPGQTPVHSNYGAALAGYIVQQVSGETFEQYVWDQIFASLGMTDSPSCSPHRPASTPTWPKG